MNTPPSIQLPVHCAIRLEFYWPLLAVYSITLIGYVAIRSLWENTLQQGLVNVVLADPVVVLLSTFVLVTMVGFVVSTIARRGITITTDSIEFTSRFHERTFEKHEIEHITLGSAKRTERRFKGRGVFSVVKVKLYNRRRVIRIRPTMYTNDKDLSAALAYLKHTLR
jgi:hypothetical protein